MSSIKNRASEHSTQNLVYIIVQELVVPEDIIVIVQIVPRDERLGRVRNVIHFHAPPLVSGLFPLLLELFLRHFLVFA